MTKTLISPFYQFCLLLVLSVSLLILDNKTEFFQPVKVIGTIIRQPFELVLGIQAKISVATGLFEEKSELLKRNRNLEQEMTALHARMRQYEAVKEENERLSRLLSTPIKNRSELMLANIVMTEDNLFNQRIIIDRGVESGVYVGQPAVSDKGVIGQVAEVGFQRSVVMLLSHFSQGIPVQIARNGQMMIGMGAGIPDRINLPYLELEADIRVGDQLITSGMGGRFHAGYHVGTVTEILKDTTRPFLQVSVETAVKARYIKNVLLLWTSEDQDEEVQAERSWR